MRVKTGTVRKRRHNKVLAATRGMRMTKGRLYKVSKEAYLHQGQYAYEGRKNRKRDLRSLWIQRINAGLKQVDDEIKYSRLIKNLTAAKITLNRKMLADLAVSDPETFKFIVSKAQQ